MKKLLALGLVIALLFTCACQSNNNTSDTIESEPTVSTPSDNTSSDQTSSEDKTESSSTSRPTENKKEDTSVESTPQYVQDPATCNHFYKKATCTEPRTCAKCGKTEGEKTEHKFLSIDCSKPAVCINCGWEKGYGEHVYNDATCTEPKTCAICSVTEGSALGHKMSGGMCIRCESDVSEFCPKLYFTGDMSGMKDKKDERNITVEYKTFNQTIKLAAKIKLQGSSSLYYEKKNFTINFYKDTSYSKKAKIDVGWGDQSKYCLKANWIDRSQSRNVVTAKLAGEINKKYGLHMTAPNYGAVDGFPIEIYINGAFHGVYTMNIPKDEWMFNMDKDNPNHIVIGGDNWSSDTYFKSVPDSFGNWELEVGEENDETLAKVQRLFNFVINSSDAEFKANFSQYLNLDATINYYIVMRFAYMRDNVGKNMLLVTYDGKVWYPTLYDMDTCWGTYWNGLKLDAYKSYLLPATDSLLWTRMEKLFKSEIAERYFELRSSILSKNHIMESFNSFHDSFPDDALKREREKWDKPGNPIPGYEISQIEDYLDTTIPKWDALFNSWR